MAAVNEPISLSRVEAPDSPSSSRSSSSANSDDGVRKVQDAAQPLLKGMERLPSYGQVREFTGVVLDVNSLLRNAASFFQAMGKTPVAALPLALGIPGVIASIALMLTVSPTVGLAAMAFFGAGSSVLAGGLGVFSGLSLFERKVDDLMKGPVDATKIMHNMSLGMAGFGFAAISTTLGMFGIYALAGTATPAALLTALLAFGAVLYGSLVLHALHALWQQETFDRDLQAAFNNKGLDGAIEFIKTEAQKPGFAARVGSSVANDLKNMREFPTDANAKKVIFEKVRQENAKQKLSSMVLLAIGGIGVATLFVSASPVLFPLFFGIGAVLWLLVDSSKVNNAFTHLLTKWMDPLTKWEGFNDKNERVSAPLTREQIEMGYANLIGALKGEVGTVPGGSLVPPPSLPPEQRSLTETLFDPQTGIALG